MQPELQEPLAALDVERGGEEEAENKLPLLPLEAFPRLISAEIRVLKYLYEEFPALV